MSHLSPSEFVDHAEGTLDAARAGHLDTCDRCQSQASSVGDALRAAAAGDPVPEPSPLFWDHLSARVREAVAAEPPQRAGFRFGFARVQPIVVTLALAVAIFSAALLTRDVRHDTASTEITPQAVTAPSAGTA